jgi:hypothetical protein
MFMRRTSMRVLRQEVGFHPLPVVILGIAGLAAFCLCSTYIAVPVWCSQQVRLSPVAVDLSPLERLAWPPDSERVAEILNLEVLGEFAELAGSHWVAGSLHIQQDDSHYSDLSVEIYLAPPSTDAEARFHAECRQRWADADTSAFEYGSEGGTDFCFSYLRALRADAFGLCLPLGYESFAVFRKSNLIITISERTSGKTSSLKGELLRRLADRGH